VIHLIKTISFILTLTFIFAGCGEKKNLVKISAEELNDKVYGSWLGQIIGNIYGLPHENAYIDEPGPENFPYGYGRNLNRLIESKGAFSDDDTDIEYIYLLTMEKHGFEPTYAQMRDAWLHHIKQRVWLANRAALGLMHFGYSPHVTGLKDFNPHWFQIDPQLVNEIWAVISPGMIKYAAQKSAWAARVTNDSWGIDPTIHYGAMFAAAFFESDVNKLIDIGTAALPEGSRFAETVEDMKALYKKYPNDWKKARADMAQKYYINENIDTKTIWNAVLNGAAGILALLYGKGDFQYTLDLACAMGYDADNQAATMAGLLGVILGVEGLPKDLLYPIEGWDEPFNDFYKDVSRHDMPDASLKDMANRMVIQAEKIILKYGGEKVTEDGVEYYLINTDAEFFAPMEFPGSPGPNIEVGKNTDYTFYISGGKPPFKWSVESGKLPDGITLQDGKLVGTATTAGIYPVTVQFESEGKKASQQFNLVVRGTNMATNANKILANVRETNVAVRDAMWLTVGYSLYSNSVNVINDGVRLGNGSTFYSITEGTKDKVDYYGYEWDESKNVGLIGYHMGSMEESGGWFTSLDVEYRDDTGKWKSVEGLIVLPELLPNEEPFNKAHFVEYLLAFKPVETNAIRIIGDSGAARHWRNKMHHFTSITELSVHEPLPDYQTLK
jgi:ADP-ribosylglycohydrolase